MEPQPGQLSPSHHGPNITPSISPATNMLPGPTPSVTKHLAKQPLAPTQSLCLATIVQWPGHPATCSPKPVEYHSTTTAHVLIIHFELIFVQPLHGVCYYHSAFVMNICNFV